MVRQPDEHVRGAVHARVVIIAIRAVNVRAQSAFRRVGDGILKFPGSRAGHKIDQRLEIPVLVERHVQDGFFAEVRVDVALFGLQIHYRCLDGDLFGHRAHLQLCVAVGDSVGPDSKTCLSKGLEAAGCDLEVVLPRCYVRNCVMTVVVGVRFTRDARRAVRDNCVCLGHSRAALVRHRTSYRAVQNLRLQRRHEQDGLNAQDS